MQSLLLAFSVVLVVYAGLVTALAALLYGQQRMMNKMSVDQKRTLRREIRKSDRYLEAFAARTGVTLFRRPTPDPDQERKPSRNIVTASQVIERQRERDAIAPRQTLERVPPVIKTHFLRDANSNGAADH